MFAVVQYNAENLRNVTLLYLDELSTNTACREHKKSEFSISNSKRNSIMRIALTIIVACLAVPGFAHDQSDKTRCKKTEQQIRSVQSKMRAGYTRAQGEKLEARLRKLRADRTKYCR